MSGPRPPPAADEQSPGCPLPAQLPGRRGRGAGGGGGGGGGAPHLWPSAAQTRQSSPRWRTPRGPAACSPAAPAGRRAAPWRRRARGCSPAPCGVAGWGWGLVTRAPCSWSRVAGSWARALAAGAVRPPPAPPVGCALQRLQHLSGQPLRGDGRQVRGGGAAVAAHHAAQQLLHQARQLLRRAGLLALVVDAAENLQRGPAAAA
jgi:hypothetical protein